MKRLPENFNRWLLLAFMILAIASCSKNDNAIAPTDSSQTGTDTGSGPGTQAGTNTDPFSITENFESGQKTAYAAANVTLNTGSWYFDDALIGNLSGDAKDGYQSVRLRNGNIAMNFDINGVKMLYVKHAKFGNDGNSTWQLLMSDDSGSTYTQIGSDISETSTTLKTDSFAISDTLAVRFKITKSGDNRVNLDDITFKGIGDPGITVPEPDTTSTGGGGGSTSDAAEPRNVTVGTDAPPASGDNSNLLLGNPSDAVNSIVSKDNYLIDMGYYTESYSASRAEPNWVSWHLDASNITHAVSRQDNFAAWASLPSDWFQVQDNSYSGSGFDRGHNCPSADRTSSADANSSTFLMTNIIPQAPNNNQHTWADLENYLRDEVNKGYEIYIIMGSYGEGGSGYYGTTVNTIDNGNITVPAHIWKIAVMLKTGDNDVGRIDSTTIVLAVNTPNTNNIDADWTKYIVTVRDIEQATGYNFLSELPKSVQDAIETKTYSAN
ncbi:DNA/RNA non-specific endonuclease [Prolixibacter sp. SD074]|uniref:DNA/RNA non-specific endonuclease n=1 Tax=Prolixibacter sp. SD074 TaxID=2652391 RepID=UPI00188EF5C6|nr:DNA/RNA non-specific endonuclease [Prolixibacter sp. SD074]